MVSQMMGKVAAMGMGLEYVHIGGVKHGQATAFILFKTKS